MKRTRTGKAVLLVRPTGKNAPPYWASDREGNPLWMTLDVEDGVIVGRTLGIWLEFTFPARYVNDAARQWRAESFGAWELRILTLETRMVGRDIKPGKPRKRKTTS